MGHIKEPEGIDFSIENRPLTNKEREEISDLINALKKKKTTRKRRVSRKKKAAENL